LEWVSSDSTVEVVYGLLGTVEMSIRVAIAGVGNCAKSLVEGVALYAAGTHSSGLIQEQIGSYRIQDIEFVAAFDVDSRKVGRRLDQAVCAEPNNAKPLTNFSLRTDAAVHMGPPLDGVARHLSGYPHSERIVVAESSPANVRAILRETRSEVLICYLPVGSTNAVRFYAEECLAAGVAFVNCVPVFIANDENYARRFREARLPIIGDDVRSQVGATIVHQRLVDLLVERGYSIDQSYQLNFGGNADFLNMLERDRLADKKRSKTRAVADFLAQPIESSKLHIGPSDYVPMLGDTKIAYIDLTGRGFGGAPISVEVKLKVEDSPNSAGVVVDVVRYAKVALERGVGGPIDAACSYYMKSPPSRLNDDTARGALAEMSQSPST